MTSFSACILQLNSSSDLNQNIATITEQMHAAKKDGADLIALPENAALMAFDSATLKANSYPESTHPALSSLRVQAADLNVWLLIGSLAIDTENDKIANRSFLIDPEGRVVARYDKIHLFDVDLPNGEHYRESATFNAGSDAVLAATPLGKFGLSICYDVRFPHLYRRYGLAGADVLFIPAAFTKVTGQAHWHTLLRARALENGCYVIAPAQCGTHQNGRETFGHSLIIDPWGKILAEGRGTAPCRIMANLDLDLVQSVRQKIPSLAHDTAFNLVRVD